MSSLDIQRPACTSSDCNKPVALIRNFYDSEGNKTKVSWRKYCSTCHNKRTAAKHGLSTITEITARRHGFDTAVGYLNSKHPYRKHRKSYCENQDGRLGFTCTTNVVWDGMLDVDHIDGNPQHNEKENLQTLCKCCHAYKGYEAKDYLSPGRKALGIKY